MILATVHTIEIILPSSPLIGVAFLFLVGFVIIRIGIRIWDLVGL